MPQFTGAAALYVGILVVALSAVTGVLVFFIKRYIDNNDKHHQNVETELKSVKASFTNHKAEMSTQADRMLETANRMEQSAVKFQKEINKELLEVQKATTQMVGDVRIINNSMQTLQSTVIKHQESLSLGAKALAQQRAEVNGIKTTITKINDELILVGQKVNKPR